MIECCSSPEALLETVGKLTQLHKGVLEEKAKEPNTDSLYWFIPPKPVVKQGSVGLWNQGNTCYQNATLQQIFMQPTLRKQLISSVAADEASEGAVKVFNKLRSTMARLAYSVSDAYDPKPFVKACDGQFPNLGDGNVYSQQDASEFYSTLTARVEEALKRPLFDEVGFLKTQYCNSAEFKGEAASVVDCTASQCCTQTMFDGCTASHLCV